MVTGKTVLRLDEQLKKPPENLLNRHFTDWVGEDMCNTWNTFFFGNVVYVQNKRLFEFCVMVSPSHTHRLQSQQF